MLTVNKVFSERKTINSDVAYPGNLHSTFEVVKTETLYEDSQISRKINMNK